MFLLPVMPTHCLYLRDSFFLWNWALLGFPSLLIFTQNGALQDKKSLKLGPEDNLYLEGFALNVFGKADKQDRAGRADLYVE